MVHRRNDDLLLRPYQSSDFKAVTAWVPDARFMLQWAGPDFPFPLGAPFLDRHNDRADVNGYCAVWDRRSRPFGYVEVNRKAGSTGRLCRVIIGDPLFRGRGLGRCIVKKALGIGFNQLDMANITLGVFSFNTAALSCYRRLGFKRLKTCYGIYLFGGERWDLIEMQLTRDTFIADRIHGSRPLTRTS
jgi:RimJ/RimL family protein N-acetyltransferase